MADRLLTLDCCWVLGQNRETGSGLIFNGVAWRVEETEDTSNPAGLKRKHPISQIHSQSPTISTHPIRTLRLCLQPDQLNHRHLHQLIHRLQPIQHAQQVPNRHRLRDTTQRHKRVPFTGCVGFRGEEGFEEFGCVRDEVFLALVDCVDGEDGVFADKGVAVFLREGRR